MNRIALFLKAGLVGFLMLLLLIPLGMINGTVTERQAYRQEAVDAVARSFAGAQTLTGPVLVVPYVDERQVTERDASGKEFITTERSNNRWIFFPTQLESVGRLRPDVRKRGLHEVRVYELQSTLSAGFDAALPEGVGVVRKLGQPYLSLSIADVRGLVGTPELKLDGRPVKLRQGPGEHREGNGLHTPLPDFSLGSNARLRVELAMTLGGTESLAIAPVGDNNRIRLESSWPHPQFAGRFLPRERRIDASGFRAEWNISSLAAGTQAQYRQGGETVLDTLDVNLVEPVNIYSQADRASKYGILFVLLTFVGFFMFELIKRLAIHPIQYALVGLALAIFFLLLISLSEHIPFVWAYLAASAACIGLLGFYLSAVLKSAARGSAFSAMLTLLYGALYGLLVSEDNALVLGSLLLFAILAAIMLVTRRIDWYALGNAATSEKAVSEAA
jgi:inner membrane protein